MISSAILSSHTSTLADGDVSRNSHGHPATPHKQCPPRIAHGPLMGDMVSARRVPSMALSLSGTRAGASRSRPYACPASSKGPSSSSIMLGRSSRSRLLVAASPSLIWRSSPGAQTPADSPGALSPRRNGASSSGQRGAALWPAQADYPPPGSERGSTRALYTDRGQPLVRSS